MVSILSVLVANLLVTIKKIKKNVTMWKKMS